MGMRRTLLLFALAASAAVRTFRGAAVVHGTIGRDASLSLLKRKAPLGKLRCDLLVRESNTRAVMSACIALRHRSTYSILQIREDGARAVASNHYTSAQISMSASRPCPSEKIARAPAHHVGTSVYERAIRACCFLYRTAPSRTPLPPMQIRHSPLSPAPVRVLACFAYFCVFHASGRRCSSAA